MSYIEFDKTKLVNLQYSLSKELLRTNQAGGYSSSTIITCNTRKYHGLLVLPQPLIDDQKHVLLSTMDETLLIDDREFHLSLRMYKENYHHPKGHKYVRDFKSDPNLKLVYRIGKTIFSKEYIFVRNEDRVLLKYNIEAASKPVKLILKPLLAFRNFHQLSKANTSVNTKYQKVKNGASWQMYPGYSRLFFQFSEDPKYIHIPDWHYNIEYPRERERGYEYHEDLFVPGKFEINLSAGESIIVSAGTEEIDPNIISKSFKKEVKSRIARDSYEHCLENAAEEFIVHNGMKTEIIAGYPWFGRWGRDTFIALPGLTLTKGDEKTFLAVINTLLEEMKDGLFPNVGGGEQTVYNSVDAPLWFFWSMQQYEHMSKKPKKIWRNFGVKMKEILSNYRDGTHFNIQMRDNGLLWAGQPGRALTWMDAVVKGKPVTPRTGFAVEINALWYNAIYTCLEWAVKEGDKEFIDEWSDKPALIKKSFMDTFFDKEVGYLADSVNGDKKDWSIRPNMIFAVSLPNTPLENKYFADVLLKVRKHLLTPRGLRTLSPRDSQYKGSYTGDQDKRDNAYHQGTVWPWLLGPYAQACFNTFGNAARDKIEKVYTTFEEDMDHNGIGTISEIYDGNPPFHGRGAISQAWCVAEILRIKWMLDNYE